MTAHTPPVLLPFARQVVTFWPKSIQVLMVWGLIVGVIVRFLPDMDNSTFSNIMFILNLPTGLTVLGAHVVLAVEKAVLTEQAALAAANVKVSV